MIIPLDQATRLDPVFVESLCCPVCLCDLHHFSVGENKGNLVCDRCRSVYLVLDGVPYFRMEDEHWKIKDDEIRGEVRFNMDTIPASVHEDRNVFIDGNSEAFLKQAGIDLSADNVLLVGSSFPELLFFKPRCAKITASDIVPDMVRFNTEETRRRGFRAAWVCADGECLPFQAESFDTVVIRQALHHMVRYYSAIGEFFRVCRTGGRVLIMDDGFWTPDLSAAPLRDLPDEFPLYDGWTLGMLREKLHLPSPILNGEGESRDDRLAYTEPQRKYLEPDEKDAESFLSDKYMAMSILQAIHAVRFHSGDFDLFWPEQLASVDMSQKPPQLCRSPNPLAVADLPDRLIGSGWMSIAARKTGPTTVFRDRENLRAISLGEDLRILPAEMSRLEAHHRLRKQLDSCEQDRQARLEVIDRVGKELMACEADRAARLQVIEDLGRRLLASEASRTAGREEIEKLGNLLREQEKLSAVPKIILNHLRKGWRS